MIGSCANRWCDRFKVHKHLTSIRGGTVAVSVHYIRAERNRAINRTGPYSRTRRAVIPYRQHRHHRHARNPSTQRTMAAWGWASAGIQRAISMHSQHWPEGRRTTTENRLNFSILPQSSNALVWRAIALIRSSSMIVAHRRHFLLFILLHVFCIIFFRSFVFFFFWFSNFPLDYLQNLYWIYQQNLCKGIFLSMGMFSWLWFFFSLPLFLLHPIYSIIFKLLELLLLLFVFELCSYIFYSFVHYFFVFRFISLLRLCSVMRFS